MHKLFNYSFVKKAFSLVEVLLVASLISLFFAVILTNMDRSKKEAVDANIFQNFHNAKAQAQYYGQIINDGSYEGVCNDPDDGIRSYLQSASSARQLTVICVDTSDDWAVEVQLSDDRYFCIGDIEVASIRETSSNLSESEPECDGV